MKLTTRQIRINGYPPLDEILNLFDALPILIRNATPETRAEWDVARRLPRTPSLVHPVGPFAEKLLNPVPELV